MNPPFLFSGKEIHDGWLDHRYQRHVGICGNGDRAKEFGRQHGGEKDGCWAVRSPDYTDGTGLFRGKTKIK